MKASPEKRRRLALARLASVASNLRGTADELEALAAELRRLDEETAESVSEDA